jgi:PIN domain nuclease of toxin-antitoxin system
VAALLLDTHVFVWGQLAPHRLTARAKNAIEEADTVWVSAISFFEIAQKARLGKWPAVLAVADSLPALHETQGGRIAPLDAEICVSAGLLSWPHRDPFDRLIAATALLRKMILASADAEFDNVLKRVW